MTATKKDPVLVVLQMSGAYDALNTIIPYSDPLYKDYRPHLKVEPEEVLAIDDKVGFHPAMRPIKDLYDDGKVAVIQGIGYPNPIRSHFRSMDIWHTAEPTKMATEGWLGRAIQDLDPGKENVLTAVNFGRGLPRALAAPGVSVASVGSLETYGVLTGIDGESQRAEALDIFSRMYSPMVGSGPINDYLSQTGLDALKGADILSAAPERYSSSIEYGGDMFSQWVKNIAQVHTAGFGTRILYTGLNPGAFDTHANQPTSFAKLWGEVSRAVNDLYCDLKEHHANEEVVMLLFTGVRTAGAGKRLRHRPRLRQRGLCDGRRREGRPVRRVSVPGAGSAGRRRPALEQRFPQYLRHYPGPVAGTGRQSHPARLFRAV